MAAIQCPQCGREIPEPAPDFCPNPDCGYPLSFAKPSEPDEPEPTMERRPLEKVEPPVTPSPVPTVRETPPPVPPIPPPVPPKPPGSGPNPGLLIAAAVAVVVVIGLVVAFAGGGGDDATPSAEPPAASDAGGDATAEPEPEVMSYARVPHDETVFGGDGDQMIHRVIAGDGQLVAVGRSGFAGEFDAALWTSSDGSTWRRVDADPAVVGGEGEQEMTAIAQTPDGYVIVGYDRTSVDENAAVWLYDGAVVTRVDPAQTALGGDGIQEMTRVVAADGRLVAVGTDGLNDPAAPDAGLWESVDGASWARVASEQLGGEHHQFMRTIAPFEDGFVGAGDELDGTEFDAAVWKLTGTSIVRVFGTGETFGGGGDQQIFSVLTYGEQLVAVGSAAGGEGADATVWISDDGLVWERISDPTVFGGPARQTMFGAIAAGDLVVAVGFDGAAGEADDAAIWQSPDGRTWSRSTVDAFGGPGEQRMKGVAVYEGTVVAVGWDGSEGDLDAAVWTSQAP